MIDRIKHKGTRAETDRLLHESALPSGFDDSRHTAWWTVARVDGLRNLE